MPLYMWQELPLHKESGYLILFQGNNLSPQVNLEMGKESLHRPKAPRRELAGPLYSTSFTTTTGMCSPRSVKLDQKFSAMHTINVNAYP